MVTWESLLDILSKDVMRNTCIVNSV